MTSRPTTVFIAGCFDALHLAHLSILTRSRALGDRLIVGINDDAHLARKGPGRPVDSAPDRVRKLMDTGLVHQVIVFKDSPLEVIMAIRPDVITVGDDYTVETTVGYPECLAWNGRVVVLPRTQGISTTQIIENRASIQEQAKVAYREIKRYGEAYKNIDYRT